MNKILRKLNHFINKAEIFFGKLRLLSYPQDVQIEPTNRCNQRCVMCPRNTRLDVPIGDLSLNNFKIIIKKIPYIRNLQLNGLGEPLLNKELPAMIKYATSKGIKVSINSNCALINKSLAEKLIDSKLNLLKISMDSPDPVIYSSIRNAPLEPVIEGIRTLTKTRREKKSHAPQIWFNSIIMSNNYKNLDKILMLGNELGIDLIRFKPINTFWAGEDKSMTVQTQELKEEIKRAIRVGEKLNVKHNLKDLLERLEANIYQRPKEGIPCYSPWSELYVQYYGGVRLCCEFCSKNDDIGNILEKNMSTNRQGFKKIWNGSKMRQIRKEFKNGNTYFLACKACNRFQKNVLIYDNIKNKKIFL